MKKVMLLAITAVCVLSCNNKTQKCYETSEQAFEALQEAVYLKDFQLMKNLTSTFDLKYIDYENLLNQYNMPTIDLIPEESDGAYGVKKINDTELYYTGFNENGVRKEIKAIQFQNKNGCYKVINIADVKSEDTKSVEKKEVKKAKQYAKITTIADGYDIQRVNLWSSPTSNRTQVSFCTNNEKVEILEYSGEYVKVKKSNGAEGWCMTGFLK